MPRFIVLGATTDVWYFAILGEWVVWAGAGKLTLTRDLEVGGLQGGI